MLYNLWAYYYSEIRVDKLLIRFYFGQYIFFESVIINDIVICKLVNTLIIVYLVYS